MFLLVSASCCSPSAARQPQQTWRAEPRCFISYHNVMLCTAPRCSRDVDNLQNIDPNSKKEDVNQIVRVLLAEATATALGFRQLKQLCDAAGQERRATRTLAIREPVWIGTRFDTANCSCKFAYSTFVYTLSLSAAFHRLELRLAKQFQGIDRLDPGHWKKIEKTCQMYPPHLSTPKWLAW